jgi:hypothetical protein
MDFYEKMRQQTKAGLEKIDEVFNPLITVIEMKITLLKEAKQDPANYFDLDENGFVNYIEMLDEYKAAKEKAEKELTTHIDNSIKEFESMEGEQPQAGEEEFYKVVFLILKEALQNGVRIKIGNVQWDSSKPLGGEGSVFVEVRDTALKAIGIDPKSDVGKLITDPVNGLENLSENTKRELETALKNVHRETERALENVGRETGQALENARRETEKAMSNVAKEVSKVLKPKIKIKKPKWL